MKKLLALLITVVALLSLSLTGCSNVKPLANVDGEVKSGNGTFIVEKGDYLYFVNGIGNFEVTNKMGEIEKGALMRIKTSDLGSPSSEKVEMVIPKLVTTSSATDGIYIFGNTVYFATAFDGKDKKGNVRKDYTDFVRFDLETAKATRIAYESGSVTDYTFYQRGENVYLAYVSSVKEDEVETKTLKAFNAKTGESMLEQEVDSVVFAEGVNAYVFYTDKAHSEALDADENYDELYRYELGETEPELILSGVGSAAMNRDNNADIPVAKRVTDNEGVLESITGISFTLIKHTGSALVFKSTDTDANNAISKYYYAELEGVGNAKVDNFSERIVLGVASTWLDTAIVSKSYYKSATEIYYVETSTYVDHLVKFNYQDINLPNHGRTILTDTVKGMSLVSVSGNVMYFSESGTGSYYALNFLEEGAEAMKINGSPMKTLTDWFVPRIINNYFIGIYSSEIFTGYIYVLDMTGIGTDEYEEAIGEYSALERAEVEALKGTLLGKMTEEDEKAYLEKLDKDYPAEEEEEE